MINYLIVMKINKYKFHCIFSLFFEDQWSWVIEILETTENKDFPQMEEFIGLWLKAHINDKKTRKKLDWYLEKELSVTKENYNQNFSKSKCGLRTLVYRFDNLDIKYTDDNLTKISNKKEIIIFDMQYSFLTKQFKFLSNYTFIDKSQFTKNKLHKLTKLLNSLPSKVVLREKEKTDVDIGIPDGNTAPTDKVR